MNRLTGQERAHILHLLCEGSSIRAVTRLIGASKNTVIKLMIDAGKVCAAYHDGHVRNLKTRRVQVDEIWSFTYAKQKNVASAKRQDLAYGDTWTWTALDADSKLMISWLVGGRDSDYAMAFMDDLRSRLANCVQLTSDGHKAYLEAVEGAFGGDVDYGQLVKIYGAAPGTSFAQRPNLNIRMHVRRFTCFTNAFSKKIENHAYSVALFTTYYNFGRIHKTLRVTPAMAAGVTDRLWEIDDIVALVEAAEPVPGKRGPYKKQGAQNSN